MLALWGGRCLGSPWQAAWVVCLGIGIKWEEGGKEVTGWEDKGL